MNKPLIEACVDSYQSCVNATNGGADRLELLSPTSAEDKCYQCISPISTLKLTRMLLYVKTAFCA